MTLVGAAVQRVPIHAAVQRMTPMAKLPCPWGQMAARCWAVALEVVGHNSELCAVCSPG